MATKAKKQKKREQRLERERKEKAQEAKARIEAMTLRSKPLASPHIPPPPPIPDPKPAPLPRIESPPASRAEEVPRRDNAENSKPPASICGCGEVSAARIERIDRLFREYIREVFAAAIEEAAQALVNQAKGA